jgi:hypothetical protein
MPILDAMPGSLRMRCLLAAVAACALLLASATTAHAAKLIVRNASQISLKVDSHNRALVTYKVKGYMHHTLWWGAINARPPDEAHPDSQVRFHYDYSGGSGSFGAGYWSRMKNVCGPYTGPPIWNKVAACTMPDGSHWVLQSWKRLMPNGGWPCCRTSGQGATELWVSHFSGPLANLWLKFGWTRRYTYPYNGQPMDQFFGRLTYRGVGVYGWHSSPSGSPTDSYGDLVWVDTLDSAWGAGWRRINSFLTHNASGGAFCDQLWPSRFGRTNSPGLGKEYRAVANGPGVTPVVYWHGPPPGNYSQSEGLTRTSLGIFDILGSGRTPFVQAQADWYSTELLAMFAAADRCHHSY